MFFFTVSIMLLVLTGIFWIHAAYRMIFKDDDDRFSKSMWQGLLFLFFSALCYSRSFEVIIWSLVLLIILVL